MRVTTPTSEESQTPRRAPNWQRDCCRASGYRARTPESGHGVRARGRKDDSLYKHRRTLLTRTNYLTERQRQRLDLLWNSDDDHVALEVTWGFYQDVIAALSHPRRSEGKKLMKGLIDTLRKRLPRGLEELTQVGRTLWRRREDIVAYFDIGASNGPVEAVNGRLEHLRGIALGFRNLDHYIWRSLIHSGQLQDRINAL
jgi:transposase